MERDVRTDAGSNVEILVAPDYQASTARELLASSDVLRMVRPLTRVGIKRSSWIGRIALGGIIGVILTGCSGGVVAPGSIAGTDAIPPALQVWAAFPVTASPRPLVIAPGAGGSPDGPHGVYGDGNVKEALLGGAFDRPAHLPSGPATAGGYPIISADKAFDLLNPHPGAIAGIRLTLTEARPGTPRSGPTEGKRRCRPGSFHLPGWMAQSRCSRLPRQRAGFPLS